MKIDQKVTLENMKSSCFPLTFEIIFLHLHYQNALIMQYSNVDLISYFHTKDTVEKLVPNQTPTTRRIPWSLSLTSAMAIDWHASKGIAIQHSQRESVFSKVTKKFYL